MSYDQVGVVSDETIEELKEILKDAVWSEVKSKEPMENWAYYKTYFPNRIPEELNENVRQYFFINIPAGGRLHKHTDGHTNSYHVPVYTNPKAICWMLDEPYRLEVGKIYKVNRQVEHHSTNEGETDRIHLLIERNT